MANIETLTINDVLYNIRDILAVTKAVDDLVNYYTKSQTYTKEEVQALLSGIHFVIAWDGESAPVVADIPAGVVVDYNGTDYTGTMAASSAELNAFYLVKSGSGLNTYDEYASIRSGVEGSYTYKWEKFGSSVVDVSGKADKVSGATADNFAGLDANGNLKDSGKKASDFATAAQGAKADTAYQKPSSGIPSTDLASGVIPDVSGFYTKPAGGIPSTDLASGVQTSLGKADTAVQPSHTAGLLKNDGTVDTTAYGTYSKPSGGIPSSDMASAVQTSLGKADTAVQPEAGKGLFSGNYNDLTNKPTIPAAQVNSDWNASSGVAQILNKPTIPDAQIQSDWNQSDNTAKDYIKNKPSIPAAQVNSDWNANSGVAQILNKPAIPDAVEANPTVPSGTTPTDLTGLKVGSNYYGVPSPTVDNTPTKNSNNLVKSGGVYDEVHPATESSQPAGGMLPNVLYKLGTLTGSVTIAFATPADANVENEYRFTFTADSTAPTITWPAAITKWAGNALDSGLPNVEASTYYEVSVVDGAGIFNKFE